MRQLLLLDLAVDAQAAHRLLMLDLHVLLEGHRCRPIVLTAPQHLLRLLHSLHGQSVLVLRFARSAAADHLDVLLALEKVQELLHDGERAASYGR